MAETPTTQVEPEKPAEASAGEDDDRLNPNSAKYWRGRIERCKRVRKELVEAWGDNVEYRRGKPFSQESDEDRVNVNLDWSLTKSKHANLFSQMPQMYLTAKRDAVKAALPKFAKQLNATLTKAKVGTAVDESTLDAINASGVGVVLCSYETITEPTKVPAVDPATLPPEIQDQLMRGEVEIEMIDTTRVVSSRYQTRRLSPSDLLWDTSFTGSDFDQADWIGYSGRMSWHQALRDLGQTAERPNGLTEQDKEKVLAEALRENLRQDNEQDSVSEDPVVEFDEIYCWAHRFDANEKYFEKINRIVFVQGKKEPVITEAWKGQKFLESPEGGPGKYVGACKFPVRLLTLTYLSDDAIPPSDTAIGRPQVDEIIRGRSQVVQQRDRSKPIRWFNVNYVDPMIHDSLMRGTWQQFIPTLVDGSKAIGEIARANYPKEEFEFDRIIKADLNESWQTGPNQAGAFSSGERSAREAGIVQANFQTRVGYERGRVASFLTGIAEVIAGFIALYGDFPDLGVEEIQAIDQNWDRSQLANEFAYYIRPDSTVLLDANQRIEKLEKVLNLVGKSGFVNPQPIIEEILSLHGIDPETVRAEPQKPNPEPPNISYRMNSEDLLNPIAIALLIKSGQAPSPEELQAAQKLLQSVMVAPQPDPVPNSGTEAPETGTPSADARPDWTPMPRVTKRVDEMGG